MSLHQIVGAGLSLLRHCNGSIVSLDSAVGSACPSPHVHLDSVRHWFGAVKTFPANFQPFLLLSPGSPMLFEFGRDLSTELAYGNHPGLFPHAATVHGKVYVNVGLGCAWYLTRA